MKIIKKVLIAVLILIISIIIFILDISNFFTNPRNIKMANLTLANINVIFWVIYIGVILITSTIKNLIYKQDKNIEKIENIIKSQANETKTYLDQNMIYNLYSANKIKEPTLWIKNSKKYEEKIKKVASDDFEEIKDFSKKERVFISFLKDIRKTYNLYEDIELINLYVKSQKEKKYYNVLESFKKENLENLRSPKYIITKSINIKGVEVKIIKMLNEVRSQEEYENLVIQVREIYIKELIRLIKTVNMKI